MMARLWARVRERWRATTMRERAGLAVLMAALAAFAALSAVDAAAAAREAEITAREHRQALEATYAQASAPALQQRLAVEANKVWRWSIVEPNEALAQVQAVALVEALAAQAGLTDAEIAPGETAAGAGSVGILLVRLSSDFEWPSFMAFLEGLESSEHSIAVEALDITPRTDAPGRLTMVLSATYLQEPSP